MNNFIRAWFRTLGILGIYLALMFLLLWLFLPMSLIGPMLLQLAFDLLLGMVLAVAIYLVAE